MIGCGNGQPSLDPVWDTCALICAITGVCGSPGDASGKLVGGAFSVLVCNASDHNRSDVLIQRAHV